MSDGRLLRQSAGPWLANAVCDGLEEFRLIGHSRVAFLRPARRHVGVGVVSESFVRFNEFGGVWVSLGEFG
jgi:hypothetical protein